MNYFNFMQLLSSSKRYEMDCEGFLTVSDYFTGKQVTLDLNKLTEEMFNELVYEDVDYSPDDLEDALDEAGLVLNEDEATVIDVLHYIEQRNAVGHKYTIKDWIRDTKANYPQTFK